MPLQKESGNLLNQPRNYSFTAISVWNFRNAKEKIHWDGISIINFNRKEVIIVSRDF